MSLAAGCTSFLCALRDTYALKTECDVQLVQRLSLPQARDRIGKITVGYADRLHAALAVGRHYNDPSQTHLLPSGRAYYWPRQIPLLESCSRATELRFGSQGNMQLNGGWTQPLLGFVCPPKVKRITHDFGFTQALSQASLPEGLVSLHLPGAAQKCFSAVQLPTTLRELRLGNSRWMSLAQSKPPYPMRQLQVNRLVNLETLVMGTPDTLVGVEWPPSLTMLELSVANTTKGELALPQGLRELSLLGFHPPLHALRLPEGLCTLRLSSDVTCSKGSLAGLVFPPALTELEVGMSLQPTLWLGCALLPPTLRILRSDAAGAPMPPNLTQLTVSHVAADAHFPDSITQLDFTQGIHPLWPESLAAVHWPRSLTSLELDALPPLAGIQLPPALTHLRFGGMQLYEEDSGSNGHSFIGMMMQPNAPSQPIAGIQLPITLRTLDIGGTFNDSLADLARLTALRSFRLHSSFFDQPLAGLRFPPQLERIELVLSAASGSFEGVVFPPALTSLRIGQLALPNLRALVLPANLRVLRMKSSENSLDLAHLQLPHALEEFRYRNSEMLDVPVAALKLPASLLTLHLFLPACTRSFADLTLPPRLRVLVLDAPPSSRFQNALLPPSLTELHLTSHNPCMPVALLQRFVHLKKLVFLATDMFGQGAERLTAQMRLPAGLETLELGGYSTPIKPLLPHLPKSLVRLVLRSESSQLMPIEDLNELTPKMLPNLCHLTLRPDFHQIRNQFGPANAPPIEPMASDWIDTNPRLLLHFVKHDR